MKTAIVLANLGAPSKQEEVRPFLKQLFGDADIFRFPFGRLGQAFFSSMISKFRAPKSRKFYQAIGGGSPLAANTVAQADALRERFTDNEEIHIFTAQRYWHPFLAEVVEEIRNGAFEKIILLPLFPHYSTTTTLSIINEWKRHDSGLPEPILVENFYGEPEYNLACAEKISDALKDFKEPPHIIFSAHSIPQSRVAGGDPYVSQIRENLERIMKNLPEDLTCSLAFQSKVGPVKWVGPPLEDELETLARTGRDQVIIYPISFVSEHVETLYELDVEFAEKASEMGFKRFVRASTVQTSEKFINVLEKLIRERL